MKKILSTALLTALIPFVSQAGPYAGGLMGYGVMNLTPDLSFSIPDASLDVAISIDFIGQDFMTSPVLGFFWQWDRFRLGTELQAFWTSLTAATTDTDPGSGITISLDHEYVWLVRPGYQLFKNTPLFLYANLGAARANIIAKPQVNAIQAINFDDNVWGYKAGLGFGYDVVPELTFRLDYIFSQYQTLSNSAPQDVGGPTPVMVDASLPSTQSQYLFGVTYNW